MLRTPALVLLALTLLLGCATAPALTPSPQAGAEPFRPNIILITAEDLSPRFGAYGDPVAVTPNFDSFASQSVQFNRVFTTAGVCAPARSALITGVHQQTLGTMHMRTSSFGRGMDEGSPYEAVPPAVIKAFPELLRAAGYFTVNRQKTDYQFGDPFTVWDDNSHSDQWPDEIPEEPFFAMINFPVTHEGRTWPPDTDPALSPNVRNAAARNARLDAQKNFELTDPARVEVPPYYPDTPMVRANLARHYDNIRMFDIQLGRLLERLEADGRFADSIIIVTTDHGDGLPRAKRTIFDTGTRVPMLVRFPDGAHAGEQRDDLVSFIDLAPTILAWADAPVPDWIQGRNLFGDPAPQAIFMGGDRFDEVAQRFRGVREESLLYIRYFGDTAIVPSLPYQNVNPIMQEWRRLDREGGLTPLQASYLRAPAPRELLFDTARDPHQVSNLANDPVYAEDRVRLSARLDRWIVESGDLGRIPEAELRERMWPGGEQPVTAAPEACSNDVGRVVLSSATPGASIGWGGEDGRANLYTGPVLAEQPVTSSAIRYGYAPSRAVTFELASLPPCH